MKSLKLFFGLLTGAGIYCYLMWYQTLGLNTLVFSILLITAVFLYKKEIRKNRTVQGLALAFFLSTISVAINGIDFSKAVYYLSMLVFLSFVQIPQLRSLAFAAESFITNVFVGCKYNWQMLVDVLNCFFGKKQSSGKKREAYVYMARAIVAFILVTTFLIIFISANPQFRKLCMNIIVPIEDFLSYVFQHISFFDIFHYGFIFYFLSLFFFRFKSNSASRREASCSDNILRKRSRIFDNFLTVGLKDECKTAVLSISLINILLLGVNIADVFSVWLGIAPDSANELSDFVHTGTYALILSTLLSIAILLFYFRQHMNLYFANKRLKQVSYIWIVQNAFLLCSVGLRNMHYIGQCGLTYKRMGVFIFLIITGIALLLLFLKIKNKKTLYYYIRTCGWTVFCTLLVSGLINWDILIAEYNTKAEGIKTDYHYLRYNLSEQVFTYLPNEVLADSRFNIKSYLEEVNNRDWQSFTFCDYQAAKKLEKIYAQLPTPVVQPVEPASAVKDTVEAIPTAVVVEPNAQ